MKKTITLVLILVLTLCLFAGCRSGSTGETMATNASRMIDDMTPRSGNAHPTDGDGFIGDGNGSRSSTMPSGNGSGNSSTPGGSNSGNGNTPGGNGGSMPGM